MNRPSGYTIAKNAAIVLMMVVITIIISCNSANKVASNFGKRKYTKGHFYDPVAKVKTGYRPGQVNSLTNLPSGISSQLTDNSTFYNATQNNINPNFGKGVRTSSTQQNKPIMGAPSFLKTTLASGKDNISEHIATTDYPVQPDHMYSEDIDNMQHTYLLGWIISLTIAVVLTLLLVAASSGSFVNLAGCLFIGLIFIVYVVAIIFFILWLVALAH